MRRSDREKPEAFALGVVDESDYAVLSTVNDDGTPYCVPLTIVREEERIYFHCALEGQKLDNIRTRPQVSLCCVSQQQVVPEKLSVRFCSAIVQGRAVEVTDPQEKAHALRILCQRHTPDYMGRAEACIEESCGSTGIVRVDILSVSGKEHE